MALSSQNVVLQLDALSLDHELASILTSHLVTRVLQPLKIYWLLPEELSSLFHALISITRFLVISKKASKSLPLTTFGMNMYQLELQDEDTMTTLMKDGLLIKGIALYLLITSFDNHLIPISTKWTRRFDQVSKLAFLINFILFIQRGRYPTLLHRVLQLSIKKQQKHEQSTMAIDEGFMSIQLLWQHLALWVSTIYQPLKEILKKIRKSSEPSASEYALIDSYSGVCPKCKCLQVQLMSVSLNNDVDAKFACKYCSSIKES